MKARSIIFGFAIIMLLSAEYASAQSWIGVQSADLQIKFDGTGMAIKQKERDTINDLRISLMVPMIDDSLAWQGEVMADTCVLNWAAGNGGLPKFGTLWPHNTGAQYVDWPALRWTSSANNQWWVWDGVTFPTRDTLGYDSAGPQPIALTFADGHWCNRRPRCFGMGGTDSANFVDTTRMMIGDVKRYYDKPGFGLLELGVEEYEFNWRDWRFLTPDTPNYPNRVRPDTAEAAAARWRKGMNYIATVAHDSLQYGKTFYPESSALVVEMD